MNRIIKFLLVLTLGASLGILWVSFDTNVTIITDYKTITNNERINKECQEACYRYTEYVKQCGEPSQRLNETI